MNHALAQQCLEALARLSENNQVEFSDIELIEALRAELEKPEPEPVAYISQKFVVGSNGEMLGISDKKLLRLGKPHQYAYCTPLYLKEQL